MKNVIALLLSMVMVVGNINGIPALAAETTAQEAVTVDEVFTEETMDEETDVTVEDASDGEYSEDIEEDSSMNSTESTEDTETAEETEAVEDVEDDDSADVADTSTEVAEVDTIVENEAKNEASSGTCGPNATWVLKGGVLTISGTGDIDDSAWGDWYPQRNRIWKVVIEEGITGIGAESGSGAFNYLVSVTKVSLPDSLTTIRDYGFSNWRGISEIELPDNVTSIGDYAFVWCEKMTSLWIGNKVTNIERHAFANCKSLTVYTENEYVIEFCRTQRINCKNPSFTIGRDSNCFVHSRDLLGVGKKTEHRMGYSYSTSLYYFGKLCTGLNKTERLDLLDTMRGEWKGCCEGIMISIGMAFLKNIDISVFKGVNNTTPSCYHDLQYPADNLNFRDLINYYHLLQYVGKHNNAKKKICNQGFGVPFFDGRWLRYSSKSEFWQSFVNDVKAASRKFKPLLLSMGYESGGEHKGHTVLTCGYREDDNYHIIRLYDVNRLDDYLYLFINKSNYDFSFSTTGNTITSFTSYARNDYWIWFEYFDADDWNTIDSSIEPVKTMNAEGSKKSLGASSNGDEYLYFTVSAGKEFRLQNGDGQYLQVSGVNTSGTLDVYEFDVLNDGSAYRFKILNSSDFKMTDFDSETKFCLRTDSNYTSVNTQNADEIRIQNNTISIVGDEFSYTLRMSKNSDDSLVELSGNSNGDATIIHDDNDIKVSAHDTDDLEVSVYDQQGNVSTEYYPESDTIIINERELVIPAKPLDTENTEVEVPNQVYNGSEIKPLPTVTVDGEMLELDKDYTVSYENNTNAGTATIIITGIGDYTGTLTESFIINKAVNKISAKNFIKTYSTKQQSFWTGVKISDGTRSFKSNSKSVVVSKSGKVTIKAKFIGKATITITAPETQNYKKNTKKITITVNPTKTALSSVTSPSTGKMTVKWKKNAVGTGYQIQYSTSSKFTSPKSVTITKNSTLTRTIGSLAKGKKYYVRIRTYKTVGSTKFYSGWSAAKSVTIKK